MPSRLQNPEQQSRSVVQRPPSGTQVSPPGQHTNVPVPSSAHRSQQHSSENEQGSPSTMQVPGGVPKQRHTPATVARQPSEPPVQQLFEAPSPHISPSGWHGTDLSQRLTRPSGTQSSEQQSELEWQSSPMGLHPER